MKTLLLGDQGYIGFRLSQMLSNRYRTIGMDIMYDDEKRVDVTSAVALQTAVQRCRPDVVIYCVACRIFESQSDPVKARKVNVQPIEDLSKVFSGKLVYFSSCHVFDGKNSPYAASAEPLPTSVYGQTKIAAENIIRQNFSDHLIIRPGYVYGHNGRQHDHFTSSVLRAVTKGCWPMLCDDVIRRYPTPLDELCALAIALLSRRDTQLLQLNGNIGVTKYEWARVILIAMGYRSSEVDRLIQKAPGSNEEFIASDTKMISTVQVTENFHGAMAGMSTILKADVAQTHFLGDKIAQFAEHVALIEGSREYTYSDLDQLSTSMGHGLLSEGVKEGARVALLLPNTADLIVAYFACLKVGAICVPLMSRLSTSQMRYILANADPTILITETSLWNKYAELACASKVKIFFRDADASAPQSLTLLCNANDSPLPTVPMDLVATIFFTSGSTGSPKGAMHTRAQLLSVARLQSELLNFDGSTRSLPGTSLCHGFPLGSVVMPTLYAGGAVILLDRPTPNELFASFRRYQTTCYSGTPVHYEQIRQHIQAEPDALNGTSLAFCNCSGDTLHPDTLGYFRAIDFPVYTSIGMTETHTIAKNIPSANRDDSLGRPLRGVEIRIDDCGEASVRGPTVALGYWRNDEATREALSPDGWFRTGDLAEIKDGFYYFRGRRTQMIRHMGVNYSPQELEGLVCGIDGIVTAGCVGVEHAIYGQQAFVCVVLKENCRKANSELVCAVTRELVRQLGEHAANAIAAVEVVDRMPVISIGKLDRSALKRLFDARSENSARRESESAPVG